MTLTGRIVAGVVVAMAVVWATASGASGAVRTTSWNTYPCGSATFDVGRVETAWHADHPDVMTVRVPGEVACGVPTPGPQYAIAVFWVGQEYGLINLGTTARAYESPSGPSRFVTTGGVRTGQPAAVCVVADRYVRLACLYIQPPGMSTPFVLRPLSPSDPLVTGTVIVTRTTNDPSCATCWT